eukprot:EST42195.1 WD40 domain-containing protein [Spironucleus salmonicida]
MDKTIYDMIFTQGDLLSAGAMLNNHIPNFTELSIQKSIQQLQTTIPPPHFSNVPPQVGDFDQYYENKHKFPINFVRFTAGGRYILSGGKDNCLKLVELQKAKQDHKNSRDTQYQQSRCRHTFYGHSAEVFDAAVHPTHDLLVSVSLDSDARFFDLRANEADAFLHSFSLGRAIQSVDFLSQNQLVFAANNESIYIYDIQNLQNFSYVVKMPEITTKTRSFVNGISCLHQNGVSLVDQRCQVYSTIKLNNSTDFVIQNSQLAVSSLDGTSVYDLRNLNQPLHKLPSIIRSVSGIQNAQFWIGLDTSKSIKLFNANGNPVNYTARLNKSYNLESVQGNENELSFCYIFDKTYTVADVKLHK